MSFAYHGKYIQVKEEFIDGKIWEKAFFRPGIVIFPMTDTGKIILVKEKRPHESPSFRLKPVTGIFEPEFSIEENAQREMQEEVGKSAKNITLFLEMKSTGTVNNQQYFVYATGLNDKKIPNPDGEDSIQEIIEVSFEELDELIWSMKLPWGLSTLGIFKLLELKRNQKLLTFIK